MTASALPDDLVLELRRMRRNPIEFTRLQASRCKLCYGKTAIDVGHPLNPQHAGTWCPVHGWLSFDSPRIKPYSPNGFAESDQDAVRHIFAGSKEDFVDEEAKQKGAVSSEVHLPRK